MRYIAFLCLLLIMLTSCYSLGQALPVKKTGSETLTTKVIQDNKQSIKLISKQLEQDLEIGYRVHQLVTVVKPSSQSTFIQVGKLTTKIVNEVQARRHAKQTKVELLFKWLIVLAGSLGLTLFPYIYCKVKKI